MPNQSTGLSTDERSYGGAEIKERSIRVKTTGNHNRSIKSKILPVITSVRTSGQNFNKGSAVTSSQIISSVTDDGNVIVMKP